MPPFHASIINHTKPEEIAKEKKKWPRRTGEVRWSQTDHYHFRKILLDACVHATQMLHPIINNKAVIRYNLTYPLGAETEFGRWTVVSKLWAESRIVDI